MASSGRRSTRHLADEIRTTSQRFRFFQAVRLLALSDTTETNKAPIPASLRFASPMSLSFPASDISQVVPLRLNKRANKNEAEIVESDDSSANVPAETDQVKDQSLEMTVSFMGLTGPSGVLPVSYTELLIDQRNQYRDTTAHAFLDMFTHRAVSLFYRAWRKHRFYLPYEAGNPDGFSRNLLDIVGVGLRHLQQRLESSGGGIPDRFLIHYAGLLSQRPIPATNIAALVHGYFGVEAELEQFVGQWMTLPAHEQSALDGRPCLLGQNTVAGERQWDRQTKVGLRLGPLDRKQFSQFIPGQPGLIALRELIRFSVGLTLDCDVTLILKRDNIPDPVLNTVPDTAPRLGYNLWLNSLPPACDASDVCFTLLN